MAEKSGSCLPFAEDNQALIRVCRTSLDSRRNTPVATLIRDDGAWVDGKNPKVRRTMGNSGSGGTRKSSAASP